MTDTTDLTDNEFLALFLFGWSERYWNQEQSDPNGFRAQWDSTWQGAGEVIEAMNAKGFWFDLSQSRQLDIWAASFYRIDNFNSCEGIWKTTDPKEAIAKAARAALEGEK